MDASRMATATGQTELALAQGIARKWSEPAEVKVRHHGNDDWGACLSADVLGAGVMSGVEAEASLRSNDRFGFI